MSKVVAFDLDDVLCYRDTPLTDPRKYKLCKPLIKMIGIMNECYDRGHEVIIYTARGMKFFDGNAQKCDEELRGLTEECLKEWGAKYHHLVFGKIYFDMFIDDKVLNSECVESIEDIEEFLDIA